MRGYAGVVQAAQVHFAAAAAHQEVHPRHACTRHSNNG